MPIIGNVDIFTSSIGHIDADSMNIRRIKPTPGVDTVELGSDATASIGLITASFIDASTIVVGTIKPTPGQGSVIIEGDDPCCVYTTGSSGVASVSSASIQPKCTTHNNSGHFSVIGGGDNHCIIDSLNTGTPSYDGIFSGKDNCILDASSTFIGGGFNNFVTSQHSSSVIGGGSNNTINQSQESSIIGGGNNCLKDTKYSLIGGGIDNIIEDDSNSAIGGRSVIVGGNNNSIHSGSRTFMGGGQYNIISSSTRASVIGGDFNCLIEGSYSFIGGGKGNCVTRTGTSFIGGGFENKIIDPTVTASLNAFETIINGNCNEINIQLLNRVSKGDTTGYNFIGTGGCNTIVSASEYGTILNGRCNTVNSALSTVLSLSSSFNTVINGTSNSIKDTSIFDGGRNLITNGDQNLISGQNNFDTIVNGEFNKIQPGGPNVLLESRLITVPFDNPEVVVTSSLFSTNNFNVTSSSTNDFLYFQNRRPIASSNPAVNTFNALNSFKLTGYIATDSVGKGDKLERRVGNPFNPSVTSPSDKISISLTSQPFFTLPLIEGDTLTFSSQSLGSNLANGTDLILTLREGSFTTPTSSFVGFLDMFSNVTGSVGTYNVTSTVLPGVPASFHFSASITLDSETNVSQFIITKLGNSNAAASAGIGDQFIIPSQSLGYGAGVQGTDTLLTIDNNTVFENYYIYSGSSEQRANLISNGSNNCIKGRASYNSILNGSNNLIKSDNSSDVVDYNTIIGGKSNKICSLGALGRVFTGNVIMTGENNIIRQAPLIDPNYCCFAAIDKSVILGGINNIIEDSSNSFIGVGNQNLIRENSYSSAIVTGDRNSLTSLAEHSGILAGKCNSIDRGGRMAIITGRENRIRAGSNEAVIIGGVCNLIDDAAYRSTIVGGDDNKIKGSFNASILAGKFNCINGGGSVGNNNSSILGGECNIVGEGSPTSAGFANTIVNGCCNVIYKKRNCYNFIGSGRFNHICECTVSSWIGGGFFNTMSGSNQSFIGGGRYNEMHSSSIDSSIVAGYSNCLFNSEYSTVISGCNNHTCNTKWSVVGGGSYNSIETSHHNVVTGGQYNCITGTSQFSAILGGQFNEILNTSHSFAVGTALTINRHCTTFVNSFDISGSLDLNLLQVPTSSLGLRTGQVYRTGSAFDELKIKL